MTLAELIERAKAQRSLRTCQGTFDDDFEAMDSECSARAAWWPFINLAIIWADYFPDWKMKS